MEKSKGGGGGEMYVNFFMKIKLLLGNQKGSFRCYSHGLTSHDQLHSSVH